VLFLLVAAVTLGAGAGQTGGRKTFDLTAKKFAFTPDRIEVSQGDTVALTIRSSDVIHGIEIRQFRVKSVVPYGGAPVTVEFVASEAGVFPITCSEFCGSGHTHARCDAQSRALTGPCRPHPSVRTYSKCTGLWLTPFDGGAM
jgi:cytochrome c oxidase subunit 2